MRNLRDILVKIRDGFHNKPIHFLSNIQEGILEKQTYTKYGRDNLRVLTNAFLDSRSRTRTRSRETRETKISLRPITTITDCVYGSVGSSSSQILVPVKPSTRTRLINVLKSQFKQSVKIHDSGDGWLIVLIPSNNLDNQDTNRFIVFDILKTIYETTYLPIAVSNALAHRIYGHGKTYSDIDDPHAQHVVTLKTIIDTNRICLDEKNKGIYNALYKTDFDADRDFLSSTIVIPKFDNRVTRRYKKLSPDRYRIINDWIFALGKRYADIGGSITNKYFNECDSGRKIILAIKKAAKHNQIPVLTGRIRAAVECEYAGLDDILSHDQESGLYSFRQDFPLKNKSKRKRKTRNKRKTMNKRKTRLTQYRKQTRK